MAQVNLQTSAKTLGKPWIRLPLVLMAAFVVGCLPVGPIERRIESQLPKYLGPADAYDVEIEGLRVRNNEADRILAVGSGVRPEGAPVLERLELDLRGVAYNRNQGRLESVDSAQAAVQITEEALATFLESHRNVQEASIDLQTPNAATVRIRPTFSGFAAPPGVTVDATGQLVGQGTQVSFSVSEVKAAGIDLGDGAAQRVSEEINPLVDLADLPVILTVKDVRVEADMIRLEVTGDPTSFQL
ncbi:MAG: DUF2993 domain-containing protein [Cyanobacteria bacterium P01_G01_bin.38]